MSKNLVYVEKGKVFCTSLDISKEFEIMHKHILEKISNLIQRIQSDHMAHVSMLSVRRRQIVRPFRQRAIWQRAQRRQLCQRLPNSALMCVLGKPKRPMGFQSIRQKRTDHAQLKRCSNGGIAFSVFRHERIFRRNRRAAGQEALLLVGEMLVEDVGHGDAQHSVAQELQPLVVIRALALGRVVRRAVGEGLLVEPHVVRIESQHAIHR